MIKHAILSDRIKLKKLRVLSFIKHAILSDRKKPLTIACFITLLKDCVDCVDCVFYNLPQIHEVPILKSLFWISRSCTWYLFWVSFFSFSYRFGLSRSKRSIGGTRTNVCPTRTHFIHPRVAFSVKGQWLYVVNLPGREDQQQGIVTEECT